jgi:hypothetical protein
LTANQSTVWNWCGWIDVEPGELFLPQERWPYTRSWEGRESGHKRFKTVVRAEDVLFLSTRERAQYEAEAVEEAVEDLPF